MEDIDIVFKNVIKLVEEGLGINEALIKLSFNRTTFYRKISKEQKQLLQITKTANTKKWSWGLEI
jgi:DNA invertase Pin-like site-specific DNA recombinase